MDIKKRFENKVLVVNSGCHEWQSTLHRDGYGKFWYKNRQNAAHRVAYELYVGAIPTGLWVLHKCDNRKCVNPDHLYVGTPKQNVADKVARCKWWGNMKIPFEIVKKCKELRSIGWTQQRIADELNIKQVQVSRYLRGVQRSTK